MTMNYTGSNGLYVSRKLVPESSDTLFNKLPLLFKFSDRLKVLDLHCTIVYSTSALDESLVNYFLSTDIVESEIVGAEAYGNYFVLQLHSNALNNDHKKWIGLGAKHGYDSYNSHMSMIKLDRELTYKELEILKLYIDTIKGQVLRFGQEYAEDLQD